MTSAMKWRLWDLLMLALGFVAIAINIRNIAADGNSRWYGVAAVCFGAAAGVRWAQMFTRKK